MLLLPEFWLAFIIWIGIWVVFGLIVDFITHVTVFDHGTELAFCLDLVP
jgi:hypothetical protein